MNPEQLKSGARWIISTFGAAIAGWFAAKGWLTSDQVMSFLTSETFIGILVSGGGLIWGLISRTNKNMVLAANNVPEVRGVVVAPTPAGIEIAKAGPDTVAIAGTVDAKDLATK